jgi:TatD DNase family protein
MNKPDLIDTHCHLYLEDFTENLTEIMSRAEDEGIREIYLPSLDSTHLQSMWDLEKAYPGRCFSMIGIHPTYVKENYEQELEVMKHCLQQRKFAAIGEIGLDYYWSREFDNYQMICFLEQIKMAKNYETPIVIHSRNSMDETINVLRSEKGPGLNGIFHCFSGNLQNAIDILECGLVLGIGGVVTYKNSGLADVVRQVPLNKIVLETDAPYLTPVPFRGKRNEPSYLKYIAEKIAEVKGITIEEVAQATTATARRVLLNV